MTLKLRAWLVPAAVVTFTWRPPSWALAGTLHLMRVALQETYSAHFRAPNFTKPAPLRPTR